MYKRFLLLTVAIIFIGCGPRYKVVYEYTQPTSLKDRECVKNCHFVFQKCEDSCASNYLKCSKDSEIIGKQNYDKRVYEYQRKYNSWLHERDAYNYELEKYEDQREDALDMYNYFLQECKKTKNKFACDKKKFYKNKTLLYNRPIEPIKPKKPKLDEEIKRVKDRMCVKNCNCKDMYNSCYVSCGGKVTSKKICIENCK